MDQTKMDEITTEMAEFICDKLCGKIKDASDSEQADAICAECEMGQFVCDILNEYNRVSNK